MAIAVTNHIEALSRAKVRLMGTPDSVFFTTICFSLKHVWRDDISTAATDGSHIYFNPKFFMSLTVEEQVFVLLHESMHVAYLHMVRLGTRNKARFNVAADYVINLQLVQRGFKMPVIALLDHQYAGMSTEQVYDLLPDSPPQGGMGGDVIPADGDPIKSEQVTQEIQDILVRASIQSKVSGDKAGTIPGDIQLFLDNLLNPKLPWNRILQKYVNSFAKDDYSFRKPNRRFFPRHHLPSLFSERLMDLSIAVDISGSVSDAEFTAFVSEIASIFRMMKPATINLLQFDTEIKSVTKLKSVQELMQCKFFGRGGTAIAPVLGWVNEHKPQLLLVFSDGDFKFYSNTTKPQAQTIWVIHNNQKFSPPFGKVMHYSI